SFFLLLFMCFFFQAEDGIRDFHVTGVQTCALPIYFHVKQLSHCAGSSPCGCAVRNSDKIGSLCALLSSARRARQVLILAVARLRSEERRVGKECRSRWSR